MTLGVHINVKAEDSTETVYHAHCWESEQYKCWIYQSQQPGSASPAKSIYLLILKLAVKFDLALNTGCH